MVALQYAGKRLAQLYYDPRLNFAASVELVPTRLEHERRALLGAEVIALLKTCAEDHFVYHRDHVILHLLFTSGMRRFSLCGITFGDLGHDARGPNVSIEIKGAKRHTLPLSEDTAGLILGLKQRMAHLGVTDGPLFRSAGKPRLDDLPPELGLGITEDGVYKMLKVRAARAGLPKGTVFPHIARHSFITWCKQAGLPDEEIVAVTGHKLPGSSMLQREYIDYSMFGKRAVELAAGILRGGP
jgi:integrase